MPASCRAASTETSNSERASEIPIPSTLRDQSKDCAMSLFGWMQRSISAQQVVAWGAEVARKCQGAVAQRLTATNRLTLTEARGYIRARSATVLDQEIARLRATTGCGQLMAV